jgi:hypothetical protein
VRKELYEDDFKPERPWWVKVGLWGLPSRTAAAAFVALSLFLALAGAALGVLLDEAFFLGLVFLFAALWYWLAIRWVDYDDDWF